MVAQSARWLRHASLPLTWASVRSRLTSGRLVDPRDIDRAWGSVDSRSRPPRSWGTEAALRAGCGCCAAVPSRHRIGHDATSSARTSSPSSRTPTALLSRPHTKGSRRCAARTPAISRGVCAIACSWAAGVGNYGGWSPRETRWALSGDVSIAYTVVGDGPFDVVLVPSISHVELAWTVPDLIHGQLPSRQASFAGLIYFDRRGIGAV